MWGRNTVVTVGGLNIGHRTIDILDSLLLSLPPPLRDQPFPEQENMCFQGRSVFFVPWHLMNFPLVEPNLFLSRLARAISIQPFKACPVRRPARLPKYYGRCPQNVPSGLRALPHTYEWSRGPTFLIKDF